MFTSALLPWSIIGGLVLSALAGAGGFRFGKDYAEGKAAEEKAIAMEVRDQAMAAAAEAISQIEIRHQTIRTQAETIIREVPVYKDPKCTHPPDMYKLLNDALQDTPEPIDIGIVSPIGSVVGPVFRGDNPEAVGSGEAVLQVSGSGDSGE
jgi:hypothetical protein